MLVNENAQSRNLLSSRFHWYDRRHSYATIMVENTTNTTAGLRSMTVLLTRSFRQISLR